MVSPWEKKQLKAGFEPDGQGEAGKEADDVEESLIEDDDDGGTEAHDS